MGRVAKYKKLKSCDPFSSKNGGKQSMTGVWGMDDNGRRPKKRSKTSIALRKKRKRLPVDDDNMFDVPPSGGDDFDLSDLLSIKKSKPAQQELLLLDDKPKKQTVVTTIAKQQHDDEADNTTITQDFMLEEIKTARILKIDPQQQDSRSKQPPKIQRLPGESRKAFSKRTKTETRQLIRNEKLSQRNPEKRQRKKEFLNKKKKKNNNNNRDVESDDDDTTTITRMESSNDAFITGEQAVARAALGDQVERPPVFEQLPRGAKAKLPKTNSSKNVSIQAEQQAMESMRRKVQAQYALVKAKRRKAGDFHL